MAEQLVAVRIVRDDGETFDIDGETWRIPNDGLENWANLPHAVEVKQNASYDGGTVTNTRIESVDRSVRAELRDPAGNARWRAAAIRFFNPKHTFACYLTYLGRTRWCEGYQYGFSCDAGNVHQPVSFDWTILCPMPYLLSVDDFGKDVARVLGKFGFPMHSVVQAPRGVYARGHVMGVNEFGKVVELENDGDVDAYPRVTVRATGKVVNPRIELSGAWVRILDEAKAGDVYTVDFTARPPRIEKNGENAIHLADRGSSFTGMAVPVGGGAFEYAADEGEVNMSVTVSYHKRYLGI